MPSAVFSSLHHFTQLRSLEERGIQDVGMDSLAAALETLPSLTSLSLLGYGSVLDMDFGVAGNLTGSLCQLCSTQLVHLTLSHRELFRLYLLGPEAVMTSLRSMAVCMCPLGSYREMMTPCVTIGATFSAHFPSLLHLSANCDMISAPARLRSAPNEPDALAQRGQYDRQPLQHTHSPTPLSPSQRDGPGADALPSPTAAGHYRR